MIFTKSNPNQTPPFRFRQDYTRYIAIVVALFPS